MPQTKTKKPEEKAPQHSYPYVRHDAGRGTSQRPRQSKDCTVRALATVMAIPYDMAYEMLMFEGRESHRGIDMTYVADSVTANGITLKSKPCLTPHKKPTMCVLDFVKSHPKGRYLICVLGHAFAVIDGVVNDLAPTKDKMPVLEIWEAVGNPRVFYL